jgi:nitrogen fixation NifU-like protein
VTAAAPTRSVRVHQENPLCGDEIELTVSVRGDRIERAAHRARACSVTLASARILERIAPGCLPELARELAEGLARAMRDQGALPEGLEDLSPVLLMPSRRKCALLPWRALVHALDAR